MIRFSRTIIRYAGWVVAAGVFLGAIGGWFSVRLYQNLRTDFEELLPTSARSYADLSEVTSRFSSIDNLAVLVFTEDAGAGKRFVIDLAKELARLPRSLVAGIEYKIDEEIRYFHDRAPLYMDLADVSRLREFVRDRIEYETELHNILNVFSDVKIPEPSLDYLGLRSKYEAQASSFGRFPDGYYATPDGKKRALLVAMTGKSSAVSQSRRLADSVNDAVRRLDPSRYSPDLRVRFAGSIAQVLEEHDALIEDLGLSTIIVVCLVTLALGLYFRAARATAALLFSLFLGTLWTFGIAYATVGYLNANSAFLGSIVIGNGINFGIILLARYLEERRRGRGGPRAVYISMRRTVAPTWTAALAAGLSYGSLMLTGFRGFSQFGLIGLIGMVLCWLSAYTILPASLIWLENWGALRGAARRRGPESGSPWISPAAWASRLVARWPGWIAAVGAIATVLAAIAIWSRSPLTVDRVMELNLGKLRNIESLRSGALALSDTLDEIFQRFLSPVVVLPRDSAQVKPLVAQLKRRMASEGEASMIAAVRTIEDFLPKDQEKKIALMEEIAQMLPERLLRRLDPEQRVMAERLLDPIARTRVSVADLPPLIRSKFTENDGSVGKLILVEPTLSKVTWQGPKLVEFIRSLREVADSVAPGIPIAATQAVTADLIEAVSRDGPRATWFAFGAVALLVALLFRNPLQIGQALAALALGVLWMTGIALGLGLKINFLNFIALPITFGIGVDYGVNVFQRIRTEGIRSGDIAGVVRSTGGAVALCSLTTIIGYGSLLIARNQAFVSFGLLAVIGEITCLLAAVVTFPALILYLRSLGSERYSETAPDHRSAQVD